MVRIGVRELRQNASKYLMEVKAGRLVEVTEHGVPVALLVPPGSMDWHARMVAEGRIIPAKNPGGLANLPMPQKGDPNLPPPSEILRRMRDSERW